MTQDAIPFRLAVLNAGGRDPEQHFPDGAGVPDDGVHAPVNYHAYAACTRGGFFRDVAAIPDSHEAVLVLLRRDLKPAIAALRESKARGKVTAISWKESGRHQVERQLAKPGAKEMFQEACALADAVLSCTSQLVQQYREAGARVVEFIPTPYPVDDPRWDFSAPLEFRSGIFIGTREWDEPSRRHAEALSRACSLGVPVTVVNEKGWRGRRKLRALGCEQLRWIEGRMPYTRWLRELSKCRAVFQLDESEVPGQVAGDALLCRMPCIGGNSAIEQLAFGDAEIEPLLANDDAWRAMVAESQARANDALSYGAIARRLEGFSKRAGDEGPIKEDARHISLDCRLHRMGGGGRPRRGVAAAHHGER